MKSLTFYVSQSSQVLYDVEERLQEDFGICPIMFPENDRHPSVQARWVTSALLSPTCSLKGKDVCVMTHSSTIISCVGDYIEDIDPEFRNKIKIVIMDKEDDYKAKVATFDEEGMLINWPIGFFSGR